MQKPEQFIMEICNITHLHNNIEILKRRAFDAVYITEHSIPAKERKDTRALLGEGYKSHLSRLDCEKDTKVWGTGVILRTKNRHIIYAHYICTLFTLIT